MSIKIALSSYSFAGYDRHGASHDFLDTPHPCAMIDHCVRFGVDGIEILSEHLIAHDLVTHQQLAELAQYAAIKGIRIVTLTAFNNQFLPDPVERADDLSTLIEHIEWASILGAPFVRVLGGRWNTIPDWDELLANKGVEPPLEGFTEQQGVAWTIAGLRYAANIAGSKGITLVLENHWGPTASAAGAKEIHDGVNSPWLKYVLDTGNFFQHDDWYEQMNVFTEDLAVLHAKVYFGGSRFSVPDIDYARVRQMLDRIGYSGYVSIEFEGYAAPEDGIQDGLRIVREHLT